MKFARITAWHEESIEPTGYAVAWRDGKFCAHHGNETLGCDPDAEIAREMCREHSRLREPIPETTFAEHCDLQSGGAK